jgi:exo-beta-1,3-glucanase (GH17 family)
MPCTAPAAAILFLLLSLLLSLSGCSSGDRTDDNRTAGNERHLQTNLQGRWIGNAICYGPHRDGQRPGGPTPSASELREDLDLMQPQWNLLRIYSSADFALTLLSIIREEERPMRVMLGAWVAVEERRDEDGSVLETFPEARRANQREVNTAIRLAAAYPDIVVAVSVGNETQIFWSAHRSPLDILIRYVREVRSHVRMPVTVADDFNYWNKPESRQLAGEIDFITMHAHPMWNGVQLPDALGWLQEQVLAVQSMHPRHRVLVGETGWATSVHDEGEQARLIKGKAGEREQRLFYHDVRRWAEQERIPVFFFEAFDENWKGGPHPDEVEKHWGLFRADRSPKAALMP